MTTAIVLDAGHATRLGGAQKGRLVVAGRTMLDWQYEALAPYCDRFLYVCHSLRGPEPWETVFAAAGGGPAAALLAAVHGLVDGEPVIVAFSDTWFMNCPPDDGDWVGVGYPQRFRMWDVPIDGKCFRRETGDAPVCTGLYRFADALVLGAACRFATEMETGEVHMADVLNLYPGWTTVRMPEWMDVGDTRSWRETDAALRRESL